MIARLWHGWTKPENADSYERFVRGEVLPSFGRINGYKGAYLFRSDEETESEFVTVTLFEDFDAVRRFAGEDYQQAMVPPEGKKLLSHFDQTSKHYQIILTPP